MVTFDGDYSDRGESVEKGLQLNALQVCDESVGSDYYLRSLYFHSCICLDLKKIPRQWVSKVFMGTYSYSQLHMYTDDVLELGFHVLPLFLTTSFLGKHLKKR